MSMDRADTVSGIPLRITRHSAGLVASDPLDNETKTQDQLRAAPRSWTYGGSADVSRPPAPRGLFQDSRGLHVGVQAPADGTYAGYFAMTRPTDAQLFHAVISSPVRAVEAKWFQVGLYVQTAQGPINYATCVAITSRAGTT